MAISEYVDVADAFFGDEEPRFVNGVLDELARQQAPAGIPRVTAAAAAFDDAMRAATR